MARATRLCRDALTGTVIALVLAGCASAPQRPVLTPAPPAPVKPPSQAVPAQPVPTSWRDMPLAPGVWQWTHDSTRSVASFQAGGTTEFVIQCTFATRQIDLVRYGATGPATALTITTSAGPSAFMASGSVDGTSATGWTVRLPARDPVFDRIANSQGRFAVAARGDPMLVMPLWAEVPRVIEDCRS